MLRSSSGSWLTVATASSLPLSEALILPGVSTIVIKFIHAEVAPKPIKPTLKSFSNWTMSMQSKFPLKVMTSIVVAEEPDESFPEGAGAAVVGSSWFCVRGFAK